MRTPTERVTRCDVIDDAPEPVEETLEAACARADRAEATRDVILEERVQLAARLAAVTEQVRATRADASEMRFDQRQFQGLVAARSELEASARLILGRNASLATLSDDQLCRLAVSKGMPSFKVDGKSADTVRARFDVMVERAMREDRAHGSLAHAIESATRDGGAQPKSRLDEALDRQEEEAKLASRAGPPAGAIFCKR